MSGLPSTPSSQVNWPAVGGFYIAEWTDVTSFGAARPINRRTIVEVELDDEKVLGWVFGLDYSPSLRGHFSYDDYRAFLNLRFIPLELDEIVSAYDAAREP